MIQLPIPVIAHIFSYCSLEEVISFSKICKKFHQSTHEESLWKSFTIIHYKKGFTAGTYRDLYKR